MDILLTWGLPAPMLEALASVGLQPEPVNGPSHAAAEAAARHAVGVMVGAPDAAALEQLRDWPGLADAALQRAWVVCSPCHDLPLQLDLLRRGVQAVLPMDDAASAAHQMAQAVERKRLERAARTAYATDLATGLPHQAQLLEHMSQLLALREREPVPMVLLVLRVEGFAQAAHRLGEEAGNVLRRKVAVRLRGALRASDVVAALGDDAFGVLLGRLEAAADGDAVAAKLVRMLQQPLIVAGQPCRVAAAVGVARYPDHGREAQALLMRAAAQAGSVAWMGPEGAAGATFRPPSAAAANEVPSEG